MGIVAGVVVAGVAILVFGRIFDLAFHIFEFAAVALLAGWVGYRLGHVAGRHEHEHEH